MQTPEDQQDISREIRFLAHCVRTECIPELRDVVDHAEYWVKFILRGAGVLQMIAQRDPETYNQTLSHFEAPPPSPAPPAPETPYGWFVPNA